MECSPRRKVCGGVSSGGTGVCAVTIQVCAGVAWQASPPSPPCRWQWGLTGGAERGRPPVQGGVCVVVVVEGKKKCGSVAGGKFQRSLPNYQSATSQQGNRFAAMLRQKEWAYPQNQHAGTAELGTAGLPPSATVINNVRYNTTVTTRTRWGR